MSKPIHVSILALPDTVASPLIGIFDVLNMLPALAEFDNAVPDSKPYQVEIVSEDGGVVNTASGLPIPSHRPLAEISHTDVIILPSVVVPNALRWELGRFPRAVDWIKRMHEDGAQICSACSGVFLLAETGLLDGKAATLHWSHSKTFTRSFPDVTLKMEKMLLAVGNRAEITMCGASFSWHDLILYMVGRHYGPPVAHVLSKFFAMQWHEDGQNPFMIFSPDLDHGDAVILEAQQWLTKNFSAPNPVEEMVNISGVSERSFNRRFTAALSMTPLKYVQHLRIEQAKRHLERSSVSIEDISWRVGYEDPAFFCRLFKRITGITPGMYRKKYTFPSLARA